MEPRQILGTRIASIWDDLQTFVAVIATKLKQSLNTLQWATMRIAQGGLLMADDMEKNRQGQQSGQSGQQSGQSGQQGGQSGQQGGQSGQRGQGGQQSGQSGQPGQQKKGGQGQNEEDEDLNRQRRAS